jgi:addiction module HigA family antidote
MIAAPLKPMTRRKKRPRIHPGELLKDEIQEINVSLNELARALRVPMNRISAIVDKKRGITVDTAIRLARYFGTSPQYWLNLRERVRSGIGRSPFDRETSTAAECRVMGATYSGGRTQTAPPRFQQPGASHLARLFGA